MKTAGEITALLNEVGAGNREAFDSVFALVYDELRRMASSCMRQERKDHTLQTTALVNEAYMKLVGGSGPQWRTRLHFFAVAATVMRHILVDYARARSTARRGGNAVRVALDEAAIVSPERATRSWPSMRRSMNWRCSTAGRPESLSCAISAD
jgi:RNA polymerase sigma-70 factor, ECF subfamily